MKALKMKAFKNLMADIMKGETPKEGRGFRTQCCGQTYTVRSFHCDDEAPGTSQGWVIDIDGVANMVFDDEFVRKLVWTTLKLEPPYSRNTAAWLDSYVLTKEKKND